MSYLHLEKSYITFTSVESYDSFLESVNGIPNFIEVFDTFDANSNLKSGESYELCQQLSTNLNSNAILKVVVDLVNVCKLYGNKVNLVLKYMYDGSFDLYLIVNEDNMDIIDISNSINKFISGREMVYIS